jgi:hypothetical protein
MPCLYSEDFRVLYLAFNSRSGIHIPCAHYKYHDKERLRLKRHMKLYLNLWLCPFKPRGHIFHNSDRDLLGHDQYLVSLTHVLDYIGFNISYYMAILETLPDQVSMNLTNLQENSQRLGIKKIINFTLSCTEVYLKYYGYVKQSTDIPYILAYKSTCL